MLIRTRYDSCLCGSITSIANERTVEHGHYRDFDNHLCGDEGAGHDRLVMVAGAYAGDHRDCAVCADVPCLMHYGGTERTRD